MQARQRATVRNSDSLVWSDLVCLGNILDHRWTNLGGEHEPLKNGHPCKTLTSVSTMSVSTISVFTMLMSTMGGRGCVASGGRKRWN